MNTQQEINNYITSQPEPKRSDIQALHEFTLQQFPDYKLWFSNGKNSDNKTVSNPTIGYGSFTTKYADGKRKEFFQIGISANQTGISVYILGIPDKTYLAKTHGDTIGKASVTGYCIRFKKLSDINMDTLAAAMHYGTSASLEG